MERIYQIEEQLRKIGESEFNMDMNDNWTAAMYESHDKMVEEKRLLVDELAELRLCKIAEYQLISDTTNDFKQRERIFKKDNAEIKIISYIDSYKRLMHKCEIHGEIDRYALLSINLWIKGEK